MRLWPSITVAVWLLAVADPAIAAEPSGPLLGFTEFRCNLPGGRHANVRTMRAVVTQPDGTGRRELAAEIVDKPDAWTQFVGWSPDGKTAIISRGWQSQENARWEEEHKRFRHTKDGWLVDAFLVELATGRATNITAVERVSNYNGGLFYWPGDDTKLGFTALIDGNSHPFRMDRDGRNKTDLTKASKEFSYGFSSSRDGRRIAYHRTTRSSSRMPTGATRGGWTRASRSTLGRRGRRMARTSCSSVASTTTVIRTSCLAMAAGCASSRSAAAIAA